MESNHISIISIIQYAFINIPTPPSASSDKDAVTASENKKGVNLQNGMFQGKTKQKTLLPIIANLFNTFLFLCATFFMLTYQFNFYCQPSLLIKISNKQKQIQKWFNIGQALMANYAHYNIYIFAIFLQFQIFNLCMLAIYIDYNKQSIGRHQLNVQKLQLKMNQEVFNTNLQLTEHLKQKGIIKTNLVFYTLMSIERRNFIPQPPYYIDKARGIGEGAIISAPHMHAYALQYLIQQLQTAKYVLDVGSGSGLLTLAMALLTPKSAKVFAIQHSPQLVLQSLSSISKENSEILSEKIQIIVGDGRKGWPNKAIKFDVIHVGAASESVPQQLLQQLGEGGAILIPIGKQLATQKYTKISKKQGKLEETVLDYVCYVPLTDLAYQKIR